MTYYTAPRGGLQEADRKLPADGSVTGLSDRPRPGFFPSGN